MEPGVPGDRQWWEFVTGQTSCSNCCVAECFPEKPSSSRNEQVCQGVKCKAISVVLRTG